MKLTIMLIVFSILGYHALLFPAKKYVDAVNGSNYNSGLSEGSAFKTIRYAGWKSNPGDTIQVAAGNYEGETQLSGVAYYGSTSGTANGMPSTQTTYNSLGLSGVPKGEHEYDPRTWITVIPKHNWREASRTIIGGNNYKKGSFSISTSKYVKFAGFEMAYTKEGISIVDSDHIIVEDFYIHHIGRVFIPCSSQSDYSYYSYGHGNGITSSWQAQYVTISKNIIHDTGRLHPGETDPRPIGSAPGAGEVVSYPHIQLTTGGGYLKYVDTELTYWKNHDHGIYVHGGWMTITNNIIFNCHSGTNGQIYAGPHSIVANNFFAHPSPYVFGNILLTGGTRAATLWTTIYANNIHIGGTYTSMVRGDEYTRILVYNNLGTKNFPGNSSYISSENNLENQNFTATIPTNNDGTIMDKTGEVYTLSNEDLVIDNGTDQTFSLRNYTIGSYGGAFQEGVYYYYAGSSSPVSPPEDDHSGDPRPEIHDRGPHEYESSGEPTNQSPDITSTISNISIDVGDAFYYILTATDPDGDQVVLSTKDPLPDWLSFNTATGVLSGTAVATGNYNITLVASDGQASTEQFFSITVTPAPVNSPPVITSTQGDTNININIEFSYTLTASDPDGDQIVLSTKHPLPDWLSFNVSTGLLSGTALADGVYDITLVASDAQASTEQFFSVTVVPAPVNYPPEFISTPPKNAYQGTLWDYHISVHDNDLLASNLDISVINKPSWINLNANTGGNGHYQFVATHRYIYLRNNSADTTTVQDFMLKYGDDPVITEFNLDTPERWETYTEDPRYSAEKIDLNTFHTMNVGEAGGFFIDGLTIGNKYTVDIETDNPDCRIANGILTQDRWELTGAPILSGIPGVTDVGDHTVTIQVTDGVNTVTQEFLITVEGAEVNIPPEFDTIMQTVVFSNDSTTQGEVVSIKNKEFVNIPFPLDSLKIFEYTVSATDADGDLVSFTIEEELPEWVFFNDNNDNTFTLSGAPFEPFNSFNITAKATDGQASVSQKFKILSFSVTAGPTE